MINKLKRIKPSQVKKASSYERGDVKLAKAGDKPKVKLKRKKGKITYYKSKGMSKPTIIDERAHTKEITKKGLEMLRMGKEKKSMKDLMKGLNKIK